jgi:hypothetical protein
MRFTEGLVLPAVWVWCAALAAAQTVPLPGATIEASGFDARGSSIPANSASTLLNFTVEGDTAGNNIFDVLTSDPGVIVSMILPSGLEVTSANASSLGFAVTLLPDQTGVDVQSVLSLPGTHTLIQIPGGQVSGVYSIKANASSVNTASAMIASYYASSTVKTAVTTSSSAYKVGDTVVLSGLVFDGSTPVTGATVSAGVSAPLSLAGQTTVGNYQLVSQQSISTNLTQYQYSFVLTNAGAAVQQVQANLASIPQNVLVVNDVFLFGDIVASSTTTSLTTLTIQRDPTSSFDPSSLQWNVTATGPVVNVSLVDSGTFDAASGDGIYTGTFTTSAAGHYTVFLSATGTSLAGNSFSRIANLMYQRVSRGRPVNALQALGLLYANAFNGPVLYENDLLVAVDSARYRQFTELESFVASQGRSHARARCGHTQFIANSTVNSICPSDIAPIILQQIQFAESHQ